MELNENNKKNLILEFEKYIKLDSNFNPNKLCLYLKNNIIEINPVFINEILLSHLIFDLVILFNDRNINKIKIFVIDQKFKEKILDLQCCFRIDFILVYCDYLFIIEFKYRSDRKQQSINAAKCIKYKMYSERFLNVLKKNYKEEYQNINKVNECGLAISYINNQMSIDINKLIYKKEDYNLESYFSEEFVLSMRRNLKRFTNLVN